jgi:hypothetical protein
VNALLAIPLARQGFLGALLLTWLQVERVAPDFLDDVILLDFALETAQRAFQSFPILKMDLGQKNLTSLSGYAPRIAVS